jgi:acetyl-CoA acyltransferase 2
MLWASLTDSYAKSPMGITAENLAVKYNLTREEVDKFAVRSQQTWAKGNEAGMFKAEMTPVEVKVKRKTVQVDSISECQ